jgi:autotransporter-associated beta strand protein
MCLSNNIVSLQRMWDWRWYKHGPYSFIISNSVVVGANGQVLGCDGGTMVFASITGAGVIAQGLEIDSGGTVQLIGTNASQIVNRDIYMTGTATGGGGKIQIQTTTATGVGAFEEVNALKSSFTATNAIVENGSAVGPVLLGVGEQASSRGYYAGMIRDGSGGGTLSIRVKAATWQNFSGTNTYSGTTTITNGTTTGISRLILDGTHVGGGVYYVNGNPANAVQQAALCGKGIISASAVNLLDNSFLAPGGVLSNLATNQDVHTATFAESTAVLTFSNAVNLVTNSSTLDIHLNGTTPGTGYDQVVIAGSGTFSNNYGNLQLTQDVGFTPSAGDKFTIVKVQGTSPASNIGIFTNLNGVPTDLSQGASFTNGGVAYKISYRAEGTTFDAGAGNGNDIMIQAQATSARSLTWRGNGADNNWDSLTTADWATNGVLTTYADGDKTTFDDTGSNNIPVNVVGALNPNTITANASKNYFIAGAGSLTGPMIITKTNTGTLALSVDVGGNSSGSTVVYQGTLQIGTNDTLGSLTGPIAVQTNGVLVHARSDDWTFTNALTGAGAFVHTGSGALILPVASTFSGQVTNAGGTFQLGDGSTADGSITANINVNRNSTLRYLAKSSSVTMNNTISGNGTVLYDAPAFSARTYATTTTLTNANFAGTNIVGANVALHAADNNAGYALGNGGVVNVTTGDGEVWLDRSATPYNQAFVLSGNGGTTYPSGAMRIFGCNVTGPVSFAGDTTIGGSINGGTISGPISGNYQLTVNGTTVNSFYLSLSNSANSWGNTLITSGGLRSLANGSISTNTMTIDLNGELDTFGTTVAVNSLVDGGSGAGVVYNMSTVTNGTLVVGMDDSSSTFDGVFGNGSSQPLNLTKVGAGTLTLSAVSTNTGMVAVNGGTLALSGSGSFNNATVIAPASGATYDVSAAGGTLTLNSVQTLKGSGTLNGSLTANANSTINPGDTIGTLTITGNANLSGKLLMELNRVNSLATNDSLVVNGALTPGGTLQVVNSGPALHVGDKFYLFPGAVSSGFTVSLPVTDANGYAYTWANNITTDGSVQVLTAAPAIANYWFRTIGNGNWNDVSVWQQSSNGVNWVTAIGTPNYTASNITVQAANLVTNTADVAVDQVTIQTGGAIFVTTGNLLITNGLGVDCLVTGKVEVATGSAGLILDPAATLSFASGGQFNWNRTAAPAIPTATWQDGSTCRISATAAANITATGTSGQSYYDFVYDTTAGGQTGNRCYLGIQGSSTVIRRDLTINIPNVANAIVALNDADNGVLTVGRNVTFQTGTSGGNKVLLNDNTWTNVVLKVAGNFISTGNVDPYGSFSNPSTVIEFNGTGLQTNIVPTTSDSTLQTGLINSNLLNWRVDSGSTTILGSTLIGMNTFTNQGTLNFGTNRITGGGMLVFGGTVNGNGSNQLVSGISAIVNGGTLNLGTLPAFAGGESFQLFGASSYSGTFGTLLPATPDGTHTWVTTQLNTAGILAVSGGTPSPAPITFSLISPNQLALNWPAGQGWTLQSQTNSLSNGLGTNWVNVNGATPPYTNTMNSANGSVFFRLKY